MTTELLAALCFTVLPAQQIALPPSHGADPRKYHDNDGSLAVLIESWE